MSEETKQPLTAEEKAERHAMTQLVKEIADQLGETTMPARNTLWRSVKVLGMERARELLERTHAIEAASRCADPVSRLYRC